MWKLSFRYNYRFLWYLGVRHINGLLPLTPEFSSPVMQGWIVSPLAVFRRPLQHLPWLFLHVFLHYPERELNVCQTESRAVPEVCQWLWGWAQPVELGAGKVTQNSNSFPLTIMWNAFQPLSKHNWLPSEWTLTERIHDRKQMITNHPLKDLKAVTYKLRLFKWMVLCGLFVMFCESLLCVNYGVWDGQVAWICYKGSYSQNIVV